MTKMMVVMNDTMPSIEYHTVDMHVKPFNVCNMHFTAKSMKLHDNHTILLVNSLLLILFNVGKTFGSNNIYWQHCSTTELSSLNPIRH